MTDIEYLEGLEYGDHKGLVAQAITGYNDLPGYGTYKLTCIRCRSCPQDKLAGKKFGEYHVVNYVHQWKAEVSESCVEAKMLNIVQQVMNE